MQYFGVVQNNALAQPLNRRLDHDIPLNVTAGATASTVARIVAYKICTFSQGTFVVAHDFGERDAIPADEGVVESLAVE
jgi:hypothetical protein